VELSLEGVQFDRNPGVAHEVYINQHQVQQVRHVRAHKQDR